MRNIAFALALLFLFTTSSVLAQESTRGSETLFVAPPASSGRTETTVVLPTETRGVTLPTPTPAPTPRVVLPAPSEITCSKSVSGQCTIFSCNDGTSTNTCDLTCKVGSGTVPVPENQVVKNSESAMVNEDLPKILKVTPDAGYYGKQVKVEFYSGANFQGYDAAILDNTVVDLYYAGGIYPKDSKATLTATFVVPKGIFAGPASLTLINKKLPKVGVLWSQNFVVTPATDEPSIVSVTPTSGKVGDVIQVKIAQGLKDFGPGYITINGLATEKASSTYGLRKENGGEYTLSVIVNSNNKSGVLQLENLSGEWKPVAADTYFTVDKTGVIATFFNFIKSFFK